MGYVVVIPARFGSQRLPGKPLLNIAGKPLIQHVYERGLACGAEAVYIATDHQDIVDVAQSFGANVIMTSMDHVSGTDRLAEVVTQCAFDDSQIVVNLQGDEPLMPMAPLRQVAHNLARYKEASVATLCEPITCVESLFNPNVVKVVCDHAGYALYFSRAPIPWDRAEFADKPNQFLLKKQQYFRHVGLYAYKAGFLRKYTQWASCAVEQVEALEQLRVLWHGGRIHVALSEAEIPPGIDTEADLARVRRYLGMGT